jgi:hypothetical protein
MRQPRVLVGLALLVVGVAEGRTFAQDVDLTPGTMGIVKEPTEEQVKEAAKRQISLVRPNLLAIVRANRDNRKRGFARIDPGKAAPPEDEIVVGPPRKEMSLDTPTAIPNAVDNSSLPYMPPVGNQQALSSCVAWATTYYQLSYETALARRSAVPTCFSPKWTYNLINSGTDAGSSVTDAYALLTSSGAPTLAQFPYDANFRAWDLNLQDWISAIGYRSNNYTVGFLHTAPGMSSAKQLLANGHILVFCTYIGSWNFTRIAAEPATSSDTATLGFVRKLGKAEQGTETTRKAGAAERQNDPPGDNGTTTGTTNPCVGQAAVTYQSGTAGAHAMTIVGYDDDLWVDINGNGVVDPGEKGCFKVVNQWGTTWGNAGFMWVPYDAFFSASQVTNGPTNNRTMLAQSGEFFAMTCKAAYSPSVIAELTIDSDRRNEFTVALGVSDSATPPPPFSFLYPAALKKGGSWAFDGSTPTTTPTRATFAFDASDLAAASSASNYFLQVFASGTGTTLVDYRLLAASSSDPIPLATGLPAAVSGTVTVFIPLAATTPPLAQPPVPAITATQTQQSSGVSVAFDGTGSTDPGGSIVSYVWTFGDGSPQATGATTQHLYQATGTFNASLTVTDSAGLSASASYTVTIAAMPPTIGAPSNLTATLMSRGRGRRRSEVVQLAWSASPDDTGNMSYTIYRSLDGATAVALDSTSSTAYEDATTSSKRGTYSYYVVANDASGNASAQSNTASVSR